MDLFPAETELVYSWQAELTAGTALPQAMSSSWNFNATLIIQQKTENLTTFKV